ncbi:MAG: hypothetical protein F6K59_12585 [Moorea sp. SIO3F7]|nr:hypothetical protein [Moorena sp. SIO3E8]NEP99728.1 hypothetical protein [Moorena sp. SIO3F7]
MIAHSFLNSATPISYCSLFPIPCSLFPVPCSLKSPWLKPPPNSLLRNIWNMMMAQITVMSCLMGS